MKHQFTCQDSPKSLWYKKFCIEEISKDARGELRPQHQEIQPCEQQDCKTLKTRHALKLAMRSHKPCDSRQGQLFDGTLFSRNLVHAFKDGSFKRRGVHGADFQWFGTEINAIGTLSGITNANTHRAPAFDDCELPCDQFGHMEGRFCGTIIEAENPRLVGCQILGTYRLKIKSTENEFGGVVEGTLEGVVMCDCKPAPQDQICIDFTTFNPGTGPNPRIDQGIEFRVRDFNGNLAPNTEIWQLGGFTGLNANFITEISLPVVASNVSVTLVHFAVPATVNAFNADNSLAGSAVMTQSGGQPETIQISGPSINRVVIDAPQNEVLILEFCYSPAQF